MYQITKNKSDKVQVLRGLAIIAVVLIHCTPGGGVLSVLCRPFINFSVGLFIFLSGVLSSAQRWNPKKRLLKLGIPYMIWTFIYTLIVSIKHPTFIPYTYLYNLLLATSSAVMYYVFVYCEFTLLIPFIDKLAKTKFKMMFFVIAPIEIIIMRLIPLVFDIPTNEVVHIILNISCLPWFSYYYLGYLLGNRYIKINLPTYVIVLMYIGAIVLQILEGYWYLSMGEFNCGTQTKISSIFAGVLFCLLAYKYLDTPNAPHRYLNSLVFLGNYSFSIFFAHMAVIYALNQIPYYKKFIFYPFNGFITIIITLLCAVIGKKILGKYAKYLGIY